MLVSELTSTGKPWLELNLTNTDQDIGREEGKVSITQSSDMATATFLNQVTARAPFHEWHTFSFTYNIKLNAMEQRLKKQSFPAGFPFHN